MSLAQIKERGTSDSSFMPTGVSNTVRCVDGFRMSVIAGGGAYCSPRPEFRSEQAGPYVAAEVGYPTARPEPWSEWERYCEQPDEPLATVYGYVPFELIEALVALHGGEVA